MQYKDEKLFFTMLYYYCNKAVDLSLSRIANNNLKESLQQYKYIDSRGPKFGNGAENKTISEHLETFILSHFWPLKGP